MKKYELSNLDLNLYYEKLDNGLEIYIVPSNQANNTYVTFSTKYGSVNNEFIPIGEKQYIKVPDGIAHFLEHKLFEQKDGIDPFTFFSERGADANASTTYFKTTYLFSGPDFVLQNINYLLDYVQNPYFTDKNILKEQGIIEQEIKMYEDDPYTRLREQNIFNLFKKHPYKYPIIGTIDSIRKITKEDLYTCYNTFYHPSNMFVVITGNVDYNEVINEIKKNQKNKTFEKLNDIKVKRYNEPKEVANEYEELLLNNIAIPKAIISYKIDISKFKKLSKVEIYNYFNILFDIKFGLTSDMIDKLKTEQLIVDELYISSDLVDNYLIMSIAFESENYSKVIELIEKSLRNFDIDVKDFERKKKVLISSNILGSDSIYAVNSKIMNNLIYYGKVITNSIDIIKDLNMKNVNYILENVNLNYKSICIVKNNE